MFLIYNIDSFAQVDTSGSNNLETYPLLTDSMGLPYMQLENDVLIFDSIKNKE